MLHLLCLVRVLSVSAMCLHLTQLGQNVLLNKDSEVSSKEDKTDHMFFRALTINLILQSFVFRLDLALKLYLYLIRDLTFC